MNHSTYMQRALELAAQGWPEVAPNPMVGCVIVKDDKIIAEGYHKHYGEAHAEVNAIQSLEKDFDFSDCTLYVNLEPCSHYGKTPPCSDLIIAKKIKTVVICNTDSNPLVGGKGIEKLRKNGIEVISGVLEKEGRSLNKRFFTFHEKKRPYIILKWAQTKDGLISKLPVPDDRKKNWITCDESVRLVHQWRAEEQAIMVGTNTVLLDNPELTARFGNGKNPIRIAIDKELKLDTNSNVFNQSSETFVFTEKEKASVQNIYYHTIDFNKNVLEQILNQLYKSNISSMIVEGGRALLQSFIDENLWDEARVFINPNITFENGVPGPNLRLGLSSPEKSGTDILYKIKNPH